MMEPVGWLWEENIAPFLRFVAGIAGYILEPEELRFYCDAIGRSDAEADRWTSIDFTVSADITLQLASDAGTCVVHVRVEADPALTQQIRGVVAFLAVYRAVERN